MIHIVYGAPCSGKTTFVANNIGGNDLRWDWDIVEQSFSGLNYQQKNQNLQPFMRKVRRLFIDECIVNRSFDNVWIISTNLNKKIIDELILVDEVVCHEMDTSIELCKSRLANSDRDDKQELTTVIDEWFKKYDEWW